MLGRKKESREIDGLVYDVTQLGGIDARNVLLRLMKSLGPSLGALADSPLSAVFEKLALSEADLGYFCEKFGSCSFVHLEDGKLPMLDKVFDDHFAGRTGAMVKWLVFAVEVNFSDFLDGAKARLGKLSKLGFAPTSSPSMSPSTSIGQSGESSPTQE